MFILAPIDAYLTLLYTPVWTGMCSDEDGMPDEVRRASLVAKGKARNLKIGGFAWYDNPNYNKTAAAIKATTNWFKQLERIGVPMDNVFTYNVFNSGVTRYSQVVWQRSDRIGCAVKSCSNSSVMMTFIGCQYKESGNWTNEKIYETGSKALQGEAKESIRKFHVTKENYGKAITFLHNRYSSSEELIQKLVNKLENYQLRGSSLKDQRSLFEKLQVVIQQLKQKGVQVDCQWMMTKVLSKFREEFQRKVLLKKRSQSPYPQRFSMQNLFDLMEDVLSEKEMVYVQMEKPLKSPVGAVDAQARQRSRRRHQSPCMY
ncbi:hypothetical protein GCK32_008140 [Trichostrongylus colubriformis]|uniref:SCP domain-containing protein n=1 Tax=Trichostrongylus colubriformis TaxID=6319 RepID=A0AAN8G1Z8_TRICO